MTNLEKFKRYLATQQQIQQDKANELSQNHRQDEAIMAKITGNIYKILIDISGTMEKRSSNNIFANITCFMQNQLRTPWQQSLATATHHGDNVKIAHENIKLSTLAEIEKVFSSIFEGCENA